MGCTYWGTGDKWVTNFNNTIFWIVQLKGYIYEVHAFKYNQNPMSRQYSRSEITHPE
jgi:hypothetical protein